MPRSAMGRPKPWTGGWRRWRPSRCPSRPAARSAKRRSTDSVRTRSTTIRSAAAPRIPSSGDGEDWYWFDCGNVRWAACPDPGSGAWADWAQRAEEGMAEAEDDTAIPFIVTFGHRPAFSSGEHEGEPELQGFLGTLRARNPKLVLNL